MKPLWIIGSGGHASEVIENALAGGHYQPVGILDDNPGLWKTASHGLPVHGPISLETVRQLHITQAVIAIGNNRVREEIAHRLGDEVTWATLIHPTAYVVNGARIGVGCVIGVHAVVQPGAIVGMHSIVNTKSVIGHDVSVDSFCHIGPGTILAGGATIGTGAFLGTSVSVIPNVGIGAWTTVGAGAVVVRDVPADVTAIGIPARMVSPKSRSTLES